MPLDGSKLDRALASAAALSTRLALFQTRADAAFNEADHPRAEDGKFGSGGGGAKGLDFKSMKRVGKQLGSNPGGRFTTPEGKSYYVKQSKSNDHAKNEVTASRLYELAGSPVLRSEPVEVAPGKLGTATAWEDVKNINRHAEEEVKEAWKDFATHAWLANWDSVGLDYDNQGRIGGKMHTLDTGGSLLYRAQGAPKGAAFGPEAKEFESLRDPSNRQAHRIFGGMSPSDLRTSAERVASVPDADIRRVVEESGPGSAEDRKALAELLIARKHDVARRAGITAPRDDANTVPVGKIRVAVDDANWKESDHPRDADGKFASTGGSGAAKKGLSDYKSSLSKNAKGSTLGMIKHMLMTGKYSEKDIIDAAVEGFGLTPDKFSYVKFGWKDLQKTGKAPPPIPKESAFEEPKDPGDKITDPDDELTSFNLNSPEPEKPVAPQKEPVISSEKTALKEAASAPPKAPEEVTNLYAKMAEVASDKLNMVSASALKKEMFSLAEHWDKILPDNQKAVAVQLQEIGLTLTMIKEADVKETLKDLKPLTGGGLAKDSANKILAALQNAYGAGPAPATAPKTAPAYKPSTPVQQAVYEKAKVLGHDIQDSARWLEDHTGKMVKSRLRTDTSKIPGDYYAKATSAYGSDPNNGLQSAVDKVMSEYSNHQRHQVITPEENKTVSYYKGTGYHAINDPLVANKGKITTPAQKRLQAAVMKCRVPTDTPSWRGMTASLQDLSGFDDAEHSVGRCFEHYNFASCSRSRDTSTYFGDKVMLKFKIPAGAHGLTIDGSGEREILLPAKSMFRIDKVEQYPTSYGGSAKHLVHCTLIGVREEDD